MSEADRPSTRPSRFVWPVRAPGPPRRERRGSELFDRLRTARLRLGITLAIFLGINLILLALYLWSRGGQTIHVTIEANGDEYIAHIDGRLAAKARLPGPEQGGIVVLLGDTEQPPSLPEPRGIDSIRVTDLASGRTLFEDEFQRGPSLEWEDRFGRFSEDHGVLSSRGEVILRLFDRDWRDYVVDATFRNVQSASITVRATGPSAGVSFGVRPFRHYDNGLALLGTDQYIPGPPIELDRTETIRSLVGILLRPYPLTFLFLAIGFLLVAGLQLLGAARMPVGLAALPGPAAAAAAGGLATFGFVVTLFLNYSYGSHLPHVPDEIAYIFQAKLLASGHLTAPPPPVAGAFDYFFPPFIIETAGRWIGVYPFGHPLLLSFGAKVGALWLVPPLVGAISVLLVFLTGRKVYSARVGLLAALLFVTSPFYLMTASNFMSHNTAAFYLAGALACIAYAQQRPLLLGALGGLSFGLLFNTQPLTAVSLVAPVGLLLLSDLLPEERRIAGAKTIAGFAAGGSVMLAAYFLYNYATTGDALTSGLELGANPSQYVGFGGSNSVNLGLQNQQAQLAFLVLVLNGWPLYVGLMFLLLPLILASRHRWDWFLLASAVCALGVYVLYIGHGVMHGPRYWYVTSPLLMLLTARGADRAAEALSSVATRARQPFSSHAPDAPWAGVAVTYALVAALAGGSLYTWLLGREARWADEFVPATAQELRGFNRADDRLIKLVEEADLSNALVLVEGDCPGWQCYGTVFWLNTPELDGDIVFARDLPELRPLLLSAFPNRFVYAAHYSPPTSLRPFGSSGAAVSNPDGSPNAPRARDIHLPTPTASPTTAPTVTANRDEQRRHDLQTISQALEQYYAVHGAYPLADGLQSFCRFQTLDSGCAVSEFLDPLPQDPNRDSTYYYLSNGSSFYYVFAVMQGSAGQSDCPEDERLRPNVDPDRLYCVHGTRPVTPTPSP